MTEGNRESRKQELRRRMVNAEELPRQERRSRRRQGRGRYVLLLLLFLVLLMLLLALHWFFRRELRSVQRGWSMESFAEGGVQSDYEEYFPYIDGLLRVTRDGAGYINGAGKTVWNQSFEMAEPYVAISGTFAAIADQGKNAIYIMNAAGTTGQAETSLPITKLSVSETGVVYALTEDREASYITVFTKEGGTLDISIKSILEGDGYPLDIAVSPDGTELLCSFAYLENGVLQNRLVFYNLSEVGQSAGSNRVVGGFSDDFKGHLCGRVRFSGNALAQAFYDGGVAFFSTKLLTSPALLSKQETTEAIRSIAYSGDYVGVITDTEQEGSTEPYRLSVYRTNGQKCYERLFAFPYSGFTLDDGRAILYREQELCIYDRRGKIRFSGTLEAPVSEVKILSDNAFGMRLMVGGGGRMENISLR
ncbi:hypothetical protein HW273_00040 [Oribacterium sp. oral taxon 102]|uniref:DUF5711 family protein n=1 Tax=Oribacterium sp. oral taxon 102 TaxID=671214 RepID=UPI0015C09ABB|nr:DUF5711 family protein [Oribacterium sp. oral taxon 102]NWO20316.1 hypothetical protein [Oribacterium sp. oral taxon 102]